MNNVRTNSMGTKKKRNKITAKTSAISRYAILMIPKVRYHR